MPPQLILLRHPLSSGTTKAKILSIRPPHNTFSFAPIATTAHSPHRINIKQTSPIVPTTALHSPSHNILFPSPSAHSSLQTNNHYYSFLSRPMTTLSQRQKEASTMPTYPEYRSLVPPLNANLHKGQGGKTTNPRCFLPGSFFLLSRPFVPYYTYIFSPFLSNQTRF